MTLRAPRSRNEADTRSELIDPALRAKGWTDDLIRREQTAGRVEIQDGDDDSSRRPAARRAAGRSDYLLRVRVSPETQPVAVALIEAKREQLPPEYGLEQGKGYADYCRRHTVRFVFSSNGHQFVEYDDFTGRTAAPRPMAEFPTPADLQARYEKGIGFALDAAEARPLLQPYQHGEGRRRYYQDAAIRAALERIAAAQRNGAPGRVLLAMATGCGKTFIAVNLLQRIAAAGQLSRALFLCDRDELRSQALRAFQDAFGADAAEVRPDADGRNAARNARIHIATYQTLGVAAPNAATANAGNGDRDRDEYGDAGAASFLTEHYPENHISHIIIDECHRSAWGQWSQALTRNAAAVHIGLTATPRRLQYDADDSPEARDDAAITANNLRYFGEPIYEYGIGQGIDDGYLAACEIRRGRVNLDITGLDADEIMARNPVNAVIGTPAAREQVAEYYTRTDYESRLLLPDRVAAMCADLFQYLRETGGPEQKTIIFCARDQHADAVAAAMNNLYAGWCHESGRQRRNPYAFKCTAASSGNEQLPDFRGSSTGHFIAATVDLLTTGVDVPAVRNIVFFRYLNSPILFHQMLGRGARIDEPSRKWQFRVYDYTNATRLLGEDFTSRGTDDGGNDDNGRTPSEPQQVIRAEGFEVRITDAGRYIMVEVDGVPTAVPIAEYRAQLAERLLREVHTPDALRERWADPTQRSELLDALRSAGYPPEAVRTGADKAEYDLYDVLLELAWGINPRTRQERADAFGDRSAEWLAALPPDAAATLRAIAGHFATEGIAALENRRLFETPSVRAAGGPDALRRAADALGVPPVELIDETKRRLLAA